MKELSRQMNCSCSRTSQPGTKRRDEVASIEIFFHVDNQRIFISLIVEVKLIEAQAHPLFETFFSPWPRSLCMLIIDNLSTTTANINFFVGELEKDTCGSTNEYFNAGALLFVAIS